MMTKVRRKSETTKEFPQLMRIFFTQLENMLIIDMRYE